MTHDAHGQARIPPANGAWIKMRTNLADCPKIASMAERLEQPDALVIGGCFLVWAMADKHSVDGRLELSASALNRKIGIPRFAEQMAAVKWLDIGEGFVTVVRFSEHNGQSAKQRAQDASRAAKYRETKPRHDPVTPERDASVTQSKRKSKSKKNSLSAPGDDVVIPEAMQRDDVLEAAAFWFQHLDVVAPDKVPLSNSPQMQAFWNDAARHGPDKFIRQVEHCTARGWKNLREVDEPKKGNGNHGYKSRAQAREDANADAFEALFAAASCCQESLPG